MRIKNTSLKKNQKDVEVPRINVPIRVVIPNAITILSICCGMNAIRFSLFGKYKTAIVLMITAAFLDGIDGRVARAVRGASVFGEQLDSLADVISFGVVPSIMLYFYVLRLTPHFGWIATLIFCIACCLRLARFNSSLSSEEEVADWKRNYFVGLPAPAGALIALAPFYLGEYFGLIFNKTFQIGSILYTIFIALLMVSRLPVYNGKTLGKKFAFEVVILFLLTFVVYFCLLSSFFWLTLLTSVCIYLVSLPIMLVYLKKHNWKTPPKSS